MVPKVYLFDFQISISSFALRKFCVPLRMHFCKIQKHNSQRMYSRNIDCFGIESLLLLLTSVAFLSFVRVISKQ